MAAEREIRIKINSVRYEVEASLFSAEELEDVALTEEDIESALEPERMEINTEGVFSVSDGRVEVSYDESEATGMSGSRTAVSFDVNDEGIITMLRSGSVSTALVFEKGKRHHCVYSTPYMPFEICVKTIDVKNLIAEAGTLELDYVIEIRGAKAERNRFSMKIID